jgi:predicted site-specific integrase-resolvase
MGRETGSNGRGVTLTLEQAARHLRISRRTAEFLCRTGGIKAVKQPHSPGTSGRDWIVEAESLPADHLLTVGSLAEASGVCARRIRTMCVDGTLATAIRVGGSWRIPLKEAAELMTKRTDLLHMGAQGERS